MSGGPDSTALLLLAARWAADRDPRPALHVLTVGAIGIMTFGVMTRASLGHTGRPLTASANITIAYLCLIVAAVIRPFAELLPTHYHLLLEIAGASWLVAFALFLVEYGPILCQRQPNGTNARELRPIRT